MNGRKWGKGWQHNFLGASVLVRHTHTGGHGEPRMDGASRFIPRLSATHRTGRALVLFFPLESTGVVWYQQIHGRFAVIATGYGLWATDTPRKIKFAFSDFETERIKTSGSVNKRDNTHSAVLWRAPKEHSKYSKRILLPSMPVRASKTYALVGERT